MCLDECLSKAKERERERDGGGIWVIDCIEAFYYYALLCIYYVYFVAAMPNCQN